MELKKIEELNAEAIEQLRKDEAIAESLEVVTEVRAELAQAFKTNQTQNATIEQLSAELTSMKVQNENFDKTVENLNSELEVFKVEKEQMKVNAHSKRLEQLSSRFKALGQDKSVEQLSKLSLDVIDEFDAVTRMAVTKKSEEQLDIATIPTDGIGVKKNETPATPVATQAFTIEKLCNVLRDAQNNKSPDAKRILHM